MVFSGLIKDLRLVGSLRIARRYFVINGFDGVIVTLGILFGFFLADVENIKAILAAGIGAAVALCISGISAVYLSEKAEKEKELKEMEKAMVKKLDKTKIGEASRMAPFATALVNGFSPFIFSILILLPFLLGSLFETTINMLYYSSFTLSAFSLFVLGLFIGKTTKENMLVYGIKTVAIGIITAAILIVFDVLFGL